MEHTDIAIVGAGPYGLSAAAHLAARGAHFRIFGEAMGGWLRNMPRKMHLKSPGRASNLSDPDGRYTLARFCRETAHPYSDWERPIPLELFASYGEWFQQTLVPGLDRRQVVSCDAGSAGFRIVLDDGEALWAKSVVVAAGFAASARIPAALVNLPDDLASHSCEHLSFERFRNQDVVVIGAGQSALETAALLKEAGARPTLVVRASSIAWGEPETAHRTFYQKFRYPRTALSFGWRFVFYEHRSMPFYYLPASWRRAQVDNILGPLGAWWLRERVEGRMPILLGWSLREAHQDGGCVELRLERGEETTMLRADHVIAGTGYRVTPASFPFLSRTLKQRIRWEFGSPILSSCFESSVPGLHFIGLASAYAFGPVMRFVAGAHAAAPRLCGHLTANHRRSAASSALAAPSVRPEAA